MRTPLVAFLAAALPLGAQPAPGGWRGSLQSISQAYRMLVEHVDPAVVQIVTSGYTQSAEGAPSVLRASRGTGSGVIIDAAGYVLTNAHVVGDVPRVQVLVPQRAERAAFSLKPGGKLVPAQVIGVDRETDIAVLKIQGEPYPFLPLGDSDGLGQGQLVFAFGSPYGLDNSVTMGIVSSVERQIRPDDPMVYIQTDAAINPGNSGGPLVDANGSVVGINTFIVSRTGANEGVGFAVPSNVARGVYEQIREHGRVRRGQVGIITQSITPALAEALRLPTETGVLVADVIPGGAAHAAGLEINDIVLAVDGRPLETSRQLGVSIYRSAGKRMALEIQRGSRKLSLEVAVLERPKDPDRLLSLVRGEQNFVPQLGVLAVDLDERVTPLLPALRKLSGVVVAGVIAQIAAQEEGLHTGDVIYSINGEPVRGLGDLKTALGRLKQGQPVAVQLERLGQLQYVVQSLE